jgi:hypothetical protein
LYDRRRRSKKLPSSCCDFCCWRHHDVAGHSPACVSDPIVTRHFLIGRRSKKDDMTNQMIWIRRLVRHHDHGTAGSIRLVPVGACSYWNNATGCFLSCHRGRKNCLLLLDRGQQQNERGPPEQEWWARRRTTILGGSRRWNQSTTTATTDTTSTSTSTSTALSSVVTAAERLLDAVYTEPSGRKRRRRNNDLWRKKERTRLRLLDHRLGRSSTIEEDTTRGTSSSKKAMIVTMPKNSSKEKSKSQDKDDDDDDYDFAAMFPKAPVDDTRTIMDLVFPNPYKGYPPPPNAIQWPTTVTEWRDRLRKTWDLYRWTWRGFWKSKGFVVEDELDKTLPIPSYNNNSSTNRDASTTTASSSSSMNDDGNSTTAPDPNEIIANVRRNAQFIKDEAVSLGNRIKQTTGIETKDDLKQIVAGAMKLFTECVNQFMAGYRKGRDDEVEQMLTQYFQTLETTTTATPTSHRPNKRRKVQARVRNRTMMIIRQRYLRTRRYNK